VISPFELQIIIILNSKPHKLLDSLILNFDGTTFCSVGRNFDGTYFALQVSILMEQHFIP
jgi:hypothetical protein